MTKVILVDGIPVNTDETGVAVINKLQADHAKVLTDAAALQAAHTKATADHAAALQAKDAEITTLKGQVLTGDALDKAVTERVKLVADGAKIAPTVKPDGLTNAAYVGAVVAAKMGDAAVAGRDDVAKRGMFDALVLTAPADAGPGFGNLPQRDAADAGAKARAAYIERLQNPGKTAAA